MITCYLRYTIDPYQIETFERYSRMILPLAAKYGGVHHGAFLPHEGPNKHRGAPVQLSVAGGVRALPDRGAGRRGREGGVASGASSASSGASCARSSPRSSDPVPQETAAFGRLHILARIFGVATPLSGDRVGTTGHP